MTRHVLIFFHGNVTASQPHSRRADNDRLFRSLLERCRELTTSITDRVHVEWGYDPVGQRERPDQRLSDAELVVWDLVDPSTRRVRSRYDVPVPWVYRIARPWRLLTQWIARNVWRLNTFSLSDSTYYTSREGEIAVRTAVYDQVFAELDKYPNENVVLHLIAESLGTVVATDFLYGLFNPDKKVNCQVVEHSGEPSFLRGLPIDEAPWDAMIPRLRGWRKRAADKTLRLGSLTMFASQLPHFVMRRQELLDQVATGRLLDPTRLGVTGPGAQWNLFYDRSDLLTYPTRRLYGPSNAIFEFEVYATAWPWRLHGGYERNREVLRRTAELLYQRSR